MIQKKNIPFVLYIVSLCLFIFIIMSSTLGWKAFIPGMTKETELILTLFISIHLPILAVNINYNLQYARYIEDSFSRLGEIEKILKTNGNFKYVGEANNAAKKVIEKILNDKNIDKIYNTFIGYKSNYTTKTKEKIEETIVNTLKNNNIKWDDILSIDGTDRMTLVQNNLDKIKDSNYHAWVINDEHKEFPVCNFIILNYSEEEICDEVYFGWGYCEGNQNESVFYSNHPKAIEFFKQYHLALKRMSINKM